MNESDYYGRTALHLAAGEGHVELIQWLLDNGADVEAKDRDGRTPVFDAVRHAQDGAIKILIDAGAKLDMEGLGMMLCEAGSRNDVPLLRRLIDNGVNPNLADYDKRTALHLARAHAPRALPASAAPNGDGSLRVKQPRAPALPRAGGEQRSLGGARVFALSPRHQRECGGPIRHDGAVGAAPRGLPSRMSCCAVPRRVA